MRFFNDSDTWLSGRPYNSMPWVVGLIALGEPIELSLVTVTDPQRVYQTTWYVLSCVYDGTYKSFLAHWQTYFGP